jgi:integrase
MKEVYPQYLGRMREIEESIKEEDINILEKYMEFCALSSGKEKTKQRKRYALQFLDIAETSFNNFDRKIIEHIYTLIKQTDREIIGKNEVIKQLKFFIHWLKDDENLLKGIKNIPQRRGYNTKKINPSTLPTQEEIETLISACKNDHKKIAMLSLQTELGLRPHELLALKWKDITIEEDIGEVKVFANKTSETRILPFKTSVLPILKWKEAYHYTDLKPNDLVFPHPYIRKNQLYRTYLSSLYRQLCQRTELRNIYPYLCRHKRMTEANKKMPSKVASAYGGHSEKTASMYTHLSEADIREVVLKQLYGIKEPDIKTKKELTKRVDKLEKELKEIRGALKDVRALASASVELEKVRIKKTSTKKH